MRPPLKSKKMKAKNSKALIPDEIILSKIMVLRDKKVMIDSDLAGLYGISTKRLNEQVKRNLKRFPDDFIFRITSEEKELIIAQFPHLAKLKFSKVLPYVFTEYGAVMLASVLNSDKAIQVNIQIVRTFTKIRKLLADNTELRLEIEKIKKKIDVHKNNIELVFKYLDELQKKKEKRIPRKKIGFRLSKKN